MNNLKNKLAVITGASSGIGKSCAKKLAKKKVDLILVGRSEEKLKDLKKELEKYKISIKTIALDVSKEKDVQNKLEKTIKKKNIDILINSAGLALGLEPIEEGLEDNWNKMIDTNIKGLLYVSKAILPIMRKQNSGHIINLGSIAGYTAYPGGNVYCATKAAVHNITEAMNVDLLHTNVKVSNIAPGAVQTEFSNTRFNGDGKKIDAVYEGYEPLKAKDVADLILYVLNTPKHVNIQQSLIMPTAQRNPYILSREGKK